MEANSEMERKYKAPGSAPISNGVTKPTVPSVPAYQLEAITRDLEHVRSDLQEKDKELESVRARVQELESEIQMAEGNDKLDNVDFLGTEMKGTSTKLQSVPRFLLLVLERHC